MDSIQKECIRINFQLLCDSLDARHIVDSLYQATTINLDEAQEFGQTSGAVGAGRRERSRSLLSTLQTRHNGYEALLVSLSQDDIYEHLVRALRDTETLLKVKYIRARDENFTASDLATGDSDQRLRRDPTVVNTEENSARRESPPPSYGHIDQHSRPAGSVVPRHHPGYSVVETISSRSARPHDTRSEDAQQSTRDHVDNAYRNNIESHVDAKAMAERPRSSHDEIFEMISPEPLSLRLSENLASRPPVVGQCSCAQCSVQTYTKIPLEAPRSAHDRECIYDMPSSRESQPSDGSCPREYTGTVNTSDHRSSYHNKCMPKLSVMCSEASCNHSEEMPFITGKYADGPTECVDGLRSEDVEKQSELNFNVDPTVKFLNNLSKRPDNHLAIAIKRPTQHTYLDNFLENRAPSTRISECYDADSERNDSDCDGFSDDDDLKYCRLSITQRAMHTHTTEPIYTMTRANLFENSKHRRQLTCMFDELSMMINKGDYTTFAFYRQKLMHNNPTNFDLKFLLLYLTASCHLWKNEYEACDEVVTHALTVVPHTTHPSRALVEILSSRCWMYFQQKKYNRLQAVLDDSLQTIHQDPGECIGKTAGWIYVDKARINMAMMTGSDKGRTLRLRREGIQCLESALQHFASDDSKDGPFGYGFAGTMLASLLLLCGDRFHTLHIEPDAEDVDRARAMLTEVEDSPHGIPGVLQVHVYLAMCDYHFRKGPQHKDRSRGQASLALELAAELSMPELLEYAKIRNDYLENPIRVEPITGRYIFGDSSSTDPTLATGAQSTKLSAPARRHKSPKYRTSCFRDLQVICVMLVVLLLVLALSYFELLQQLLIHSDNCPRRTDYVSDL